MRRENFFIALHNRGLMDLRMCGRKYAWQTQTLDWSLEYALWNPIFEAMAAGVPIKEVDVPRLATAYVRHTHTAQMHTLGEVVTRPDRSSSLNLRLRILGVLSILGSPFVLMYLIVYYFFIYTEVRLVSRSRTENAHTQSYRRC